MLRNLRLYSKKIIIRFAKNIILKHVNHARYTKKCLLVYITKPFVTGTKARHPNYFEAKGIVKVLDDLRYDVDVVFFCNDKFKDFDQYDLIIGLGDCFDNSVLQCKSSTVRIYYATGANFIDSFSNEVIRWSNLYDRRGIVKSSSRFGMPRNPQLAIQSMKNVDGVITVGGQWCASTYSMWEKKIYQVGVIPFTHYSYKDMDRNISSCKYNFLWLGGKGLVHKGLDLVLESFACMPDYNLYIACEYEKGFFECFAKELNMRNIHYVGFVNTESRKFYELSNNCAYTISASCSEGICTSVLTCMHTGLIPVTNMESGIDHGYQIEDCDTASIIEVLQKLKNISDEDVRLKMEESYQFVKNNYSAEAFCSRFESALTDILEDRRNV